MCNWWVWFCCGSLLKQEQSLWFTFAQSLLQSLFSMHMHWWRKDCVRKLAAEERSELVCKAHCRSRKEPWLSTAPSMPAGHPLPLECCQLARGDCEGLMKDSTNSNCDSQLPLTVAAAFLHFCSSLSIFSSNPSVLIHFNRSWMAECLFLTAFATGL